MMDQATQTPPLQDLPPLGQLANGTSRPPALQKRPMTPMEQLTYQEKLFRYNRLSDLRKNLPRHVAQHMEARNLPPGSPIPFPPPGYHKERLLQKILGTLEPVTELGYEMTKRGLITAGAFLETGNAVLYRPKRQPHPLTVDQ